MTELHDDLSHAFKRTRWGLILRGVIALAFGIFALMRPLQTIAILGVLVALWALITGFIAIVHAFDVRHYARHWWMLLIAGIVGVLFGVVAITRYPGVSLAFMVLIVGWWLFVEGIFEITTSIQQKRLGWPWGWHMVLGVVSLIAAAFALFMPPVTLVALSIWIGISAIAIGILQLVEAGAVKKLQKQMDTVAQEADRTRRAA